MLGGALAPTAGRGVHLDGLAVAFARALSVAPSSQLLSPDAAATLRKIEHSAAAASDFSGDEEKRTSKKLEVAAAATASGGGGRAPPPPRADLYLTAARWLLAHPAKAGEATDAPLRAELNRVLRGECDVSFFRSYLMTEYSSN